MNTFTQRFRRKIITFFEIILWVIATNFFFEHMGLFWAVLLASFVVATIGAILDD